MAVGPSLLVTNTGRPSLNSVGRKRYSIFKKVITKRALA